MNKNIVNPWRKVTDFLFARDNYKTKKIKARVYLHLRVDHGYDINLPDGKTLTGKCSSLKDGMQLVDNWLEENGWILLEKYPGMMTLL